MWWCTQICVYMCTTLHVYPHVQHIKLSISKSVYLYQATNVLSYIHEYFMMFFCQYFFTLYTYKEWYITWYCTPY